MKREDCSVGMKVYFGRGRGEKTPGEVIKCNPSRAKVRQIGERGTSRTYVEGTVWTVPYSLLTPADVESSEPVILPSPLGNLSLNSSQAFRHYHRGDYVKFTNRRGVEVHGIVQRVNKKTVTVKPMEGGTTWRVSPGLLTKVHGREIS
jgi:hypothetical protein